MYLTEKARRPFKVADLYRLALDDQIRLALLLPTGMTGTVRRVEGEQVTAGSTERIDGLWSVPLKGAARRQVEANYYQKTGLPSISMEGTSGAIVVRPDLICHLRPDPGRKGFYSRSPSAFPEDSVLVVETTELSEPAATLLPSPVVAPPDDLDKPLATRERSTLLTIIAALAKRLRLDVSKPSAAAADIEKLTEAMGARVPARTVEEHLRKIPDALEKRSKSSL